MEKVNIILENGVSKEVYSIFYLYNFKYYLIYTEKELDENGYVILHLVQVGKEIKNTPDGPLDTGYMLGVEITNEDEWKSVQKSITRIVEDKKGNGQSADIQYLPINMLSTLKIVSKNTFRLMKSIIEGNFNLKVGSEEKIIEKINDSTIQSDNFQPQENESVVSLDSGPLQTDIQNELSTFNIGDNEAFSQDNVIIDYRAKFFEEQDRNKKLQDQIDSLTQKLDNIKKIIE